MTKVRKAASKQVVHVEKMAAKRVAEVEKGAAELIAKETKKAKTAKAAAAASAAETAALFAGNSADRRLSKKGETLAQKLVEESSAERKRLERNVEGLKTGLKKVKQPAIISHRLRALSFQQLPKVSSNKQGFISTF